MTGRIIAYTAAELKWIKRHCRLPRRAAHAKFSETFSRADVSLENFKALCKRHGWLTGRTGCFKPGSVSWNKGKAMPFSERSAQTQFKKGNRPHNTKFAGHERIDKADGYVYMSITEPNPHTGFARRYVLKHKHLWEQVNGLVPRGMCLKCLDGNRTNTDPSNWEPVPRGVNALLNGRWSYGFDEVPGEVKPTVMALAKLKYAAKQRSIKNRKYVSSANARATHV